jgi:hypothetical protein
MNKKLTIFLFLLTSFCFSQKSDTILIKRHLTSITETKGFRNFLNVDLLNSTAEYLFEEFNKYADSTFYQEFQVNGLTYKNVVAQFNKATGSKIIVGAHYDVCGMQKGADDNASGIVGLLEIARLLPSTDLNHPVELVAYCLEEPPFFRSENMGSYIHAKSLVENRQAVYGMISIEMIGYFTSEKKTQDYPLKLLQLIYGSKGDFITLVNKFHKGKFAKNFTKKFDQNAIVKTKKFVGPKALPGIDFSDHLNYWSFGFSALMITDTAFYRNKNYHQDTDIKETLDILKMSEVIDSIVLAIGRLN